MEPRFTLKDSTPRSSKTELIISGLRVYLYGLKEVEEQGYSDVALLHLAHGRCGTYNDVGNVAHEILYQYRSDGGKKKAGLIAVAIDMRNHGERKLSDKANQDWTDGNELHAHDMLAAVSGSAQDFELLINYLPTYLPQFTTFYNIMSGISLGGHTSWRLATSAVKDNKLHGLAIIIGCPNQTALLLSRLGLDPSTLSVSADDLYKVPYDRISAVLTDEQRQRWPRALHDLVAQLDRDTAENFPRNIPTYILTGKLDSLVPDRFTQAWVSKRRDEGYMNLEYFVQENTGHNTTKEMVDNISQWLVKLFAA